MLKKLILITIVFLIFIVGYSAMRLTNPLNLFISPLKVVDEQSQPNGRCVEFSFTYNKQSTIASNQFAIWIEDMDGGYIKTLYVTEYTALDGYRRRPTSIAQWASSSNRAAMSSKEIDAISGATPKTGQYLVYWDFTDNKGNVVTGEEYRYFIEGTMYYDDNVLYSGIINISDDEWSELPTAEYTKTDSEFISMIENVEVKIHA